jgi:hypothetical protein
MRKGYRLINSVRLLIAIVVFFAFGLLTTQSYARIDPGTIYGLWLFDKEGADIEEDMSGNGSDGTIEGKPKWASGKFGKAMEFDGVDDYVDCGDNDTLDVGTGDFSILAWIKCADYLPSQWEGQIVSKLHETAPRHGYLLGVRGALDANNKTKPVFRIGLATDVSVHVFGTHPINDETWHHLAVTADRDGSVILYRDGEVETQMSIAGSAKENEDNDHRFRMGRHDQHGGFYQGLIDEVALFKAALTAADVDRIMTIGLERALGMTVVSPDGNVAVTWGELKNHQ